MLYNAIFQVTLKYTYWELDTFFLKFLSWVYNLKKLFSFSPLTLELLQWRGPALIFLNTVINWHLLLFFYYVPHTLRALGKNWLEECFTLGSDSLYMCFIFKQEREG